MFSLNKNYPDNLKLRQMVTDLIFWHKDIDKDDLNRELITHHYELLRDSVAQNLALGSPVLSYTFESFTGSDLDELDWLVGFGLFKFKARAQRKPEKLGMESNTCLDDYLTVEITPTNELTQYINNPSNENRLIISTKITDTLQKYQDHEQDRETFFMDFCYLDQNGQILSVIIG